MTLDDMARVALGFVLEDETWPVFFQWMQTQAHSTELEIYMTDNESASLLSQLRHQFIAISSGKLRN